MSYLTVKKRLGVGIPDIEAYLHRSLRPGDVVCAWRPAFRQATFWKVDARGFVEKHPYHSVFKRVGQLIVAPSDIFVRVNADGSAVFGVENTPEATTYLSKKGN